MEKNSLNQLTPKFVIILLLGSLFFTLSILYIEEYINKKAQMKALEEVSKAYSISIKSFRDFYSKIILEKLHSSEISITHDYMNKENAVPIPATMSIDLVSFLNNNNAKAHVTLTSEYPFPWRKNRVLSPFDKEALNYFRTTSQNSYSKFTTTSTNNMYKYAVPIRMGSTCVSCHNSHSQSPKKDWKVGDIRGVQVITLEPEVIAVNSIEDRIYFIIAIILFFTFNISLIIWLLQRNNFAFKLLMKDKHKVTEALDSANKANKAKDNFLANISHEIRTPLNAIIGFSDILTDTKLEKTAHEQAQIISTSAKSLLSIINDILDFSKMESGNFDIKPEADSVYKMSQNIFNLFNVKASEKNITLNFKYDESIPPLLHFDALRLQQVISNLLGNAIKFTPTQGSVEFNVELLTIENNQAKIQFMIKDSGIGIPEDKQELIFKPFSQADDSVTKQYGGTGLGLTIINKILQMMNSTINLKSKENEGSEFSFELSLPISSEQENSHTQKSNELVKNDLLGKILIAEDNPINQKLMQAMLAKYNLETDYANDGLEAFELYTKNRYNLVFMDINMPNCDGVESTKKIRSYEKSNTMKPIPIIALTANAIKGDKEKYLEQGMSNYIDKPINALKLDDILKEYLEEKVKVTTTYSMDNAIKSLQLDKENVKLLIENFFETLDEDLQQLEEAIKTQNAQAIYSSAHYMKGPASNFCMNEATEELEKIEIKAQCGDIDGYDLEKIKSIFNGIKQAVM